ncbi:hypothetical protein [Sorangium sp. So ce341]|uniref:hypothetical protein n=1 Tax=Sorangium sp. So ce341 TaxID=3133302 RepID=UPI003F63BFC4
MRRGSLAMTFVMIGFTTLSIGLLTGACSPPERSFHSGGGSTSSGGGAASGTGGIDGAGGSGGIDGAGGSGGSGGIDGAGGDAGHGASDAGGGPPDVPPRPPEVIAEGLSDPHSIAVDDRNVFILSPPVLLRCPVAGCPEPVVLAKELPPDAQNRDQPYLIAVDSLFVHWAGTDGYYRCPAGGCPERLPQLVVDRKPDPVRQLDVTDDGVVHFVDRWEVVECVDAACSSLCASGDSLRSFVMDGTKVYFAEGTSPWGVYFCTPGQNHSWPQLHGEVVAVMTIHDDVHYGMSASTGSILTCHKDGCGGSPDIFVGGEQGLTSMAVGSTGVYWTSNGTGTSADGAVKMCPLTGCGDGPRIIASGQARPTSVRLRNGFVYWANRGLDGRESSGQVMRAGL